ncbi:MAG: DoxX family protein [Cytophagaceae bacterium]|nr:DoxX family protein [Cytophagaceae bacterium]MBL0327720.1 DoxX family protein [Cytophagaceae bacterium]
MKIIANFSRILVGLEFIFSGFVKVVDPYGTGLKLEEYFEVFAGDIPAMASFFEFFASHSLVLSLLFCALELILGVALVFSFRMKMTAWMVLGLMGFFTFLTFYSAYFNKVTDCGCFGDFLKFKPWHSFLKDVISMVFIMIIFLYRNKYKKSELGTPMVLISTILTFGIGIYGIRYLPLVDFLPYASGKSIPKQMEQPKIKPELSYVFLDKSTGKEIDSKEYLPDTIKYKYVSSEVLNESEIKPKITDYALADTAGNDFTQQSFEGNKLLITIKYTEGLEGIDFGKIKSLVNKVSKRKVEPMILHSLARQDIENIISKNNLNYGYYTCDEKVLKTMARNNPCIILLKNGTVVDKWSYNNLPDADKITELLNQK